MATPPTSSKKNLYGTYYTVYFNFHSTRSTAAVGCKFKRTDINTETSFRNFFIFYQFTNK